MSDLKRSTPIGAHSGLSSMTTSLTSVSLSATLNVHVFPSMANAGAAQPEVKAPPTPRPTAVRRSRLSAIMVAAGAASDRTACA
eukprot:3758802-Prymnesium_polylepis.2